MKNLFFILLLLSTNPVYAADDGKYRTVLVEKAMSFADIPERVLVNFPDQIALFLDIYFPDKFPEIHRTRFFNRQKDFAVVRIRIMNFYVRQPGDEEHLDEGEDNPRHGGKRFVAGISVLDGKTGKPLLEDFSVNYHDHVAGREEGSALLMDDTVCVIARQIAQIIGTKWTGAAPAPTGPGPAPGNGKTPGAK